jgi:hypothetical protein
VLLGWSSNAKARSENLILLDAMGEFFVRAAQLPEGTSPDCFVNMKVDGAKLSANTWSSYLVTVAKVRCGLVGGGRAECYVFHGRHPKRDGQLATHLKLSI